MAQAVPEQALRILGQCKLLARQGVPLLAELTELAGLIARFIDLSITKRTRVYEDGTRETGALVQAFVDLDADLAGWEARLGTWWTFFTRKCVSPPQAVFQGRAHCYGSMLIGRTWNHYRWARILVNQVLFDLKARYPLSAELILSGEAEWDRVALVKSLAEDILASTPFHYRHPNLSDEDLGAMETERRQGAGSAGVSVLLFHLKVAGSVSKELWDWAFEIARTIWGTMGTKIASSIMEDMISGRDGLLKAGIYQDFGTEAGLGVGLGAC